ncbi:MAG: SprT family protein [Bacilli bacterium]
MNDKELQLLVEQISERDFHRPFIHKATFNSRLRSTGGRYMLRTGEIQLSKKHFEQFGMQELIGIIKHELCHYHLHQQKKGYKHRDHDFRTLLRAVGAPRFCSTLEKKEERTLTYRCVSCKQVFLRKRKMNIQRFCCGGCRGKLELVIEE